MGGGDSMGLLGEAGVPAKLSWCYLISSFFDTVVKLIRNIYMCDFFLQKEAGPDDPGGTFQFYDLNPKITINAL